MGSRAGKLKSLAALGLAALLAAPAGASTALRAAGGKGAQAAFAARARPGKAAARAAEARRRARELAARGTEELKRLQYSAAVSRLEEALRADPASAEVSYLLGSAYYPRAFQRGSPEKADASDARAAAAAFQDALALDPALDSVADPYLLYHGLAMCRLALKRYDPALAALRQAARLAPTNPMPPLYAAYARDRLGDAAKAGENLRMSVERARRLGALPALAKLVRTDPMFSGLLLSSRARDLLGEEGASARATAGEEEPARDSMRDALSADARRSPAAPAPERSRLTELLDRARLDFKYGRFRGTVEKYSAALEEDRSRGGLDSPQRSMIYAGMGKAYRELGLMAEALDSLERAAAEAPENASAHYQMALAHCVSGEYSKAVHSLDRALREARTAEELRRTLILARTDPELDPIRLLPEYRRMLEPHAERLSHKL